MEDAGPRGRTPPSAQRRREDRNHGQSTRRRPTWIFARTSGSAGGRARNQGVPRPRRTDGDQVEEYLWTFKMPTDHGRVSLRDVGCRIGSILGARGQGDSRSSSTSSTGTHPAAPEPGRAQEYCIEKAVEWSTRKVRKPCGNRSPRTRRSSSRTSSCTRNADDDARAHAQDGVAHGRRGPLSASDKGRSEILGERRDARTAVARCRLTAASGTRAQAVEKDSGSHRRFDGYRIHRGGRRYSCGRVAGVVSVGLHEAARAEGCGGGVDAPERPDIVAVGYSKKGRAMLRTWLVVRTRTER